MNLCRFYGKLFVLIRSTIKRRIVIYTEIKCMFFYTCAVCTNIDNTGNMSRYSLTKNKEFFIRAYVSKFLHIINACAVYM